MENSAKSDHLLLLINPKSSKGKAHKIATYISTCLAKKNIPFISFENKWPDQINEYKEAWVIGGDGTLNYFLNFYKDVNIPIAIFKGGTGNDFACKLYGDINIEQQIDLVLSADQKFVDAGKCNGQVFINGIGIGFDGEVLQSINAIRWIGGHLGYYLAVLKQIFSFKELSMQIGYDNEKISAYFLLTLICNSSRMGGGFMVSPESKLDDGLLNVILCKPLKVTRRLRYLPVIEKGNHLSADYITQLTAAQINITCNKIVPLQIDGELVKASVFNITVMPKRYLFKY
ncbi:MAG: YegS/Rv2252/BmrU family lipid kinase [Chitinophagaceae bacterium]|nr:YegS/Rv2252/BmrU family lipid kinase [Chitinophagaceae bacterium]